MARRARHVAASSSVGSEPQLTILTETIRNYIEYEPKMWQFDGFRSAGQTGPFAGPPTSESNARWDEIIGSKTDSNKDQIRDEPLWANALAVTMHGLSAKQNARLPIPSVATWEDPTLFPVAISVFHDMHVSIHFRVQGNF